MREYVVYKHTFPNGKVYIGITSQKPEKRYAGGKGYKGCPKMNNAILKYGWNNIEHEILYSGLSKEEAEAKEIETIAFCNSVTNGYNTDHGGNAPGTHSIETRLKISEGNRGKAKPPWTEECKLRHSQKFSGANNPYYGKHHTQETKDRQSEFMRGNQFNKGNHHTDAFKALKSKEMREKYANGGNPRCIPVISTDQSGNDKKYYSLRNAASAMNKSPATILKYIRNGHAFCDCYWRYEK